ncbi:uncharacterized protein DEA37_0003823 [Paragonimus westermani]|uniref:Uncharacterized protein n=1 Tax=Paragonimus westermani TaxID=34504 RepID=A0A5J4NJW8_9TREM|nr:uncharacterized protein DEA37_0003823 [Paragonimus westermani]
MNHGPGPFVRKTYLDPQHLITVVPTNLPVSNGLTGYEQHDSPSVRVRETFEFATNNQDNETAVFDVFAVNSRQLQPELLYSRVRPEAEKEADANTAPSVRETNRAEPAVESRPQACDSVEVDLPHFSGYGPNMCHTDDTKNHDIGSVNENGGRLLHLCAAHELAITNTQFQSHANDITTFLRADVLFAHLRFAPMETILMAAQTYEAVCREICLWTTLANLTLIWLRQYPNVSFVDITNTQAQSVQPEKRFAVTATKWAIFNEFKQQRASKYDPVVEEVELLDCNPQYAQVRLPNGKEETVSVKHLAPRGGPGDLGTSECLADANDLIQATEIAYEICSNDEAADFPTPTNYELLKQKQQRLHPYNLSSREA